VGSLVDSTVAVPITSLSLEVVMFSALSWKLACPPSVRGLVALPSHGRFGS
jgi:hypothetical protein